MEISNQPISFGRSSTLNVTSTTTSSAPSIFCHSSTTSVSSSAQENSAPYTEDATAVTAQPADAVIEQLDEKTTKTTYPDGTYAIKEQLDEKNKAIIRYTKDGNKIDSRHEFNGGVQYTVYDKICGEVRPVMGQTKFDNGSELNVMYNYDYANGHITSQIETTENGLTETKFEYEGDNLTNIKSELRSKNGEIITSSYDNMSDFNKGNPKHKTIENMFGLKIDTDFEYDEQGRTLVAFSKKDDIRTRVSYSYEGNSFSPRTISTDKYNGSVKTSTITTDYGKDCNYENRTRTEIFYEPDGQTVRETNIRTYENNTVKSVERLDGQGNRIYFNDNLKADGNLSSSFQGGTGDCYFLASLNALNQSEKGKQIIKNNINESTDSQGKKVYNVTFAGAEKIKSMILEKYPNAKLDLKNIYSVTEEELLEKAQGETYAQGDLDIIIMEIAYEKLKNNLKDDLLNLKIEPTDSRMGSLMDDNPFDLGYESEALFMITGNKSDEWQIARDGNISGITISPDGTMHLTPMAKPTLTTAPAKEPDNAEKLLDISNLSSDTSFRQQLIQKLIKDYKDGKFDNNAATASFMVRNEEDEGLNYYGHAFTISGINENEVTLINPWDSTREIKISMEDFLASVKDITVCPLE